MDSVTDTASSNSNDDIDDVETLVSNNKTLLKERNELSFALSQMELLLKEKNAQMNGLVTEVNAYKREVEALVLEQETLAVQLEESEGGTTAALMSENESLRTQLSIVSNELQRTKQTVQQLQEQMQDREGNNGGGDKVDAASHQRAIQALNDLHKQAEEARQEYERTQDELTRRALKAKELQEEQAQQVRDLQEQLQRLQQTNDDLKMKHNTLKRESLTKDAHLLQAIRAAQVSQAQSIYATPQHLEEQMLLLNSNPQSFPDDDVNRRNTARSFQNSSPQPQQLLQQQQLLPQMGTSMLSSRPSGFKVEGLAAWDDDKYKAPTNGPPGAYYFPVTVLESQLSNVQQLQGPAWLRMTHNSVSLLHQTKWTVKIDCPLVFIKRYGKDEGIMSFEFGRKAPCGNGVLYLATIHMEDVFDVLKKLTAE
eukprot:m.9067 g.9067  ORF g.9067 m.9067 type:complete len:425 (-) comp6258_c0_seq1:139-1413(-)